MFQVAIAGVLSDDRQMIRRLEEFIGQVRLYMDPENTFTGIRMLYAPVYGTEGVWDWMNQAGYPIRGYCNKDASEIKNHCDSVVQIETPIRSNLGEMLCDHADLLIMVWDEDVTALDGASWELLRIAHRKQMPCFWISSQTDQEYWVEDTLYVPFRPEKLTAFCELAKKITLEPKPVEDRRIPLLNLGKRLYKHFLSHYKASSVVIDSKTDRLMQESYRLEKPFTEGEPMRRSLLSRYQSFDKAAIELNDKYQSVLYWRAVLPFITTIFLAIGFYAVSVVGIFPLFDTEVLEVIAGICFLINGLLNLYVFMLSRSETVRQYQTGMIKNRQIAELLRVIIHFAPFGIHLDLRKLSGGDLSLSTSARRMIEESEIPNQIVTKQDAEEALEHVEELLSDQIAYHQLSLNRFSRVAEHLETVSRVIFFIGFWFVVLRAGYQFALLILEQHHGIANWLAASVYDITRKKMISNFANMFAMILPAWAAYFSSKLSLGNYRFNCDIHQRMAEELREELNNIESLREAGENLSAEALHDIGEGLAEIMLLKDNEIWARKYKGTQVTHL